MSRLVSIALILVAVNAAADPLKPADVFEIEWASDPRVSPDAQQIVYVRNHFDIMQDRRVRHVWRVDVDGKRHRPLITNFGSISQPTWSPSGDRLAFVAVDEGKPQIHLRWEDTGQVSAVTRLRASPSGLSWSPDGRWIAFSMNVPVSAGPSVEMPDKPEGAEWAPAATYIDQLIYRFDGGGYVEPGFSHLFVVPAEGGTPRQVTEGNFDHDARPSWTADGRALIFSANRSADAEFDPNNSEL